MVIERQSFPSPWSLAMFVLELSKPGSICLVAVDKDDQVCGYLICSKYDSVWHLMNVSVKSSVRRRGIAGALLGRMFEMTRREGVEQQYTLEVRLSNTSAIQMYKQHGFSSSGIRHRYYQNDGEDALIMWLTVSEGGEPASGLKPGLLSQL